jgi:hypothetical protein
VDGYAEDESWYEHGHHLSLSDQGYDSFECMRDLARDEGMAEEDTEGATYEGVQDFVDWSLGGTWWRVPGGTRRGDDGEGSGGDDAEQGEAGDVVGDGVMTDDGAGGSEERPWQLVQRGGPSGWSMRLVKECGDILKWEAQYGPRLKRADSPANNARWSSGKAVAEDLRMAVSSLRMRAATHKWRHEQPRSREEVRMAERRVQRFRDRLMQLDRAERKQREAGRGRGGSRRR